MKENEIGKYSDWVALFAGLIFVSHPVQTQAVTYIVQRAASMAAMFYVGALCLYIQSRLIHDNRSVSNVLYTASLLTTVMAMFTKETTITLPLMIAFYEWSFLRDDRGPNWGRVVPYLLTVFIIPLTMYLTESPAAQLARGIVPEGPTKIPVMYYLLTQCRVILTYIRLVFLPINQNLDYDYLLSQSIFEVPTFLGVALLMIILFYVRRLFLNYRMLGFFAFWFFLTLMPESSFFPIKDLIFEHRLYLPMVGGSIFLAAGAFYFFRANDIKKPAIFLSVIVICFSILTYQRNKVWKNEFTLWSDVIKKSPYRARPYNNFGAAYSDQGNWPLALHNFDRSIELDPAYAEPYYNRGTIYARQGKFAQAGANFTKALELKPQYAGAYYNRGCAYMSVMKFDQAIIDFSKALGITPDYPEAYYSLGLAYEKLGDNDKAILNYKKALDLEPDYEGVYRNMGVVYENEGKLDLAILNYTKAIEIDPNNAQTYYDRANTYVKQSDLSKAILDYARAFDINPNYVEAYQNLGYICSVTGKLVEALYCYNKAIMIDPHNGMNYKDRAMIYYRMKEYDKARGDMRKAEELGVVVNSVAGPPQA